MQTVLAPWISLMFFMSVHAFEVDYCGDNDEDKNIEVFDVYAKRTGSFVKRFSWEISVRENGEGVLTVHTPEKDKVRNLRIKQEKLDELKKAIEADRFFDLPKEIGKGVPGGGMATIRIKLGKAEKTVTMIFTPGEKGAREDSPMKRAERIWKQVTQLFEDEDAAK